MPPPDPTEPVDAEAPIDAARRVAAECRAWRGEAPAEAVLAFGHTLAARLDPALPPPLAVAHAVRTATAADPKDRYRDPAELALALELWCASALDRPPPAAPRVSPWLDRAAWVVAIPGLVLLAFGLAAVVAGWAPQPRGLSFTVPPSAEDPP